MANHQNDFAALEAALIEILRAARFTPPHLVSLAGIQVILTRHNMRLTTEPVPHPAGPAHRPADAGPRPEGGLALVNGKPCAAAPAAPRSADSYSIVTDGNGADNVVPFLHWGAPRTPESSPALQERGEGYPDYWYNRVPLYVCTKYAVGPDQPFRLFMSEAEQQAKTTTAGAVYPCWVNRYGAVVALLPNGESIGLRPHEFDVVGWHPAPAIAPFRYQSEGQWYSQETCLECRGEGGDHDGDEWLICRTCKGAGILDILVDPTEAEKGGARG